MVPRRLVLVVAATTLAASGGCGGLPGGTPGLPTELPTDIGIPTVLPSDLPTELPGLPGDGEDTAAPPAETVAPAPTDDGQAAPAPSAAPTPAPEDTASAVPAPTASEEPGLVADVVDGIPGWVWVVLVLLVLALVAATVVLRRLKQQELQWAALWHELTGEARWLDERVVPAVQDRSLDPQQLVTRWQDGQRRFDDLDRRVWAAANDEKKPQRTDDLNALSEALLRLRDAVDTEVSLRASGVEQPGLPDAAQTVADARDELRRTVNARTR
ncbi:hypothetical protein [Aquipuribacter nitratireducens]|uniref:Uncharacterized protein n=1 Tax=Aquipuribacter nitratireducens TaxID=650104 RepID=A0ABW0GJW9_9MICO